MWWKCRLPGAGTPGERSTAGNWCQAIAAGGFYLSSTLADLLQADLDISRPNKPQLSAREEETLGYIARGFTHAQTATRMGITPATVDTYVERIRRKLGLGNKADLTRMAIERGLDATCDDND